MWEESIPKKLKIFTPEYEKSFDCAVAQYKKCQQQKLDRKSRNPVHLARKTARK